MGPGGPNGHMMYGHMMGGPDRPRGHNGPMGPMGPGGPMGLGGQMGPNGPNGPMGPNGHMGPSGPMGPIGPMDMGPNGHMGRHMGPMGHGGHEPSICNRKTENKPLKQKVKRLALLYLTECSYIPFLFMLFMTIFLLWLPGLPCMGPPMGMGPNGTMHMSSISGPMPMAVELQKIEYQDCLLSIDFSISHRFSKASEMFLSFIDKNLAKKKQSKSADHSFPPREVRIKCYIKHDDWAPSKKVRSQLKTGADREVIQPAETTPHSQRAVNRPLDLVTIRHLFYSESLTQVSDIIHQKKSTCETLTWSGSRNIHSGLRDHISKVSCFDCTLPTMDEKATKMASSRDHFTVLPQGTYESAGNKMDKKRLEREKMKQEKRMINLQPHIDSRQQTPFIQEITPAPAPAMPPMGQNCQNVYSNRGKFDTSPGR